MPPLPSLTRRQRQILMLMREHGAAVFFGQTRKFFWWETDQGIVIRAYQAPEFFLKARGFIRPVQMNAPGQWYRLTEAGEQTARALSKAANQ